MQTPIGSSFEVVEASGWVNTDLSDDDRKVLIASGIIPVNDIFIDLWRNQNKINLLYGGYGSGKSVFIQTLLLDLCRQPGYFKCYYGRKVKEDVRGSVHSKFVTLIEDLCLQEEFQYSTQPNGSMVIRHVKTGNSFHEFGANKSDGLKSIDDPTHFFLEEMDQFTVEDFGVILSRLRTKKAETQLYGAFNTAKVFPDHWLKKTFFPDENKQDLTEAERLLIEQLESFGVYKLFCNYTDNYFIDQDDYYNKLVIAAAGDMHALEASAKGEWGSHKAINPFATQYQPAKHESREAVFRPQTPIIMTFDFNLDPFSCTFSHIWRDEKGEHKHTFDELSIPSGTIDKICDQIKLKYGKYLPSAFITGDAMGKRRSLEQPDNSSNYKLIMRKLGLRETQMKLPANPKHSNSRTDVNYVLYHFPDYKINPQTCPGTCRDMRNTECNAYGDIIKKNRNDPNQLADFLDCERYTINAFLRGWIEWHQKTKRL